MCSACSVVCCGVAGVWWPSPPRRGFEEKRSRFLKLFSVWRGGDPATAGCDEDEEIGEEGPCQGVWGPFLHFPHFPTIAVFPSPLDETVFRPSASRFSTPAARRSSPPETPAVPARSPFDSTVRDYRRFPAPEDAKCIKITHGGIEIQRRENA